MRQQKPNNSLAKYTKSQDEANMVASFENQSIAKLDIQASSGAIIDVLSKWRFMLGISSVNRNENEVAAELAILTQFIIKNYSALTVQELELCIDLSLTGKLEVDVRSFNVFSAAYVSKVLNAYLEYKRAVYNQLHERKDKVDANEELTKVATPIQRMDGMIELIRYFHEKYLVDGRIDDTFNVLYAFFKRTKRIKANEKMIADAIEYGKKEAETYISMLLNLDYDRSQKPSIENVGKRFARNYCVQKLFDKINIEDLILSIQLKEFE